MIKEEQGNRTKADTPFGSAALESPENCEQQMDKLDHIDKQGGAPESSPSWKGTAPGRTSMESKKLENASRKSFSPYSKRSAATSSI
jgi:hypothetical protein